MNDYLETVIQGIDVHSGTVDKIIGDEVMALMELQDILNHALQAVAGACFQIRNLERLQSEYKCIKVMNHCGIGINTGDMVVGNMGGEVVKITRSLVLR